MKKLYTIALAAFAALTANAAQPKVLAGEFTPQQLTLGNTIKETNTTVKSAAPQREAEETEDEWVKVSTGIWFEGPLAARLSYVDEGQWEVDIYENESQPGWIRLYPYPADCPVGQQFGRADTNPLDICISDPDKVYFLDWAIYGSYTYGSYCTENDWNASKYGTLADGTITFEAGTIAYYNSGWYLYSGEIKIVLDKDTYVDYTVTADAPFCASYDDQYIRITAGDAISTVKVYVIEGHYPMNDNNATVVKYYGLDYTNYLGYYMTFDLDDETAEWTYLYVGLDADGNIQAQGAAYTYIISDDTDNWVSLGTGTYTEGILSQVFTNIYSDELTCEVQENVNTPGYYRLVNPYADHTYAANDGHNHYIYINATDPDHVYLETSPIGVYVGSSYGYVAAKGWGLSYLDDLATGESYGLWGKLAEGVVNVPAIRIQLSNYNDGEWLSCGLDCPFSVTLPKPQAPVHDIKGVDENNAVTLKDGDEINITAVNGEDVYYAWETVSSDAAAAKQRVPSTEEFSKLEDGTVTFTADNDGDQKYLHYYAQNATSGAVSELTSILITRDGTALIEAITADTEAAVEYYNLQGVRVNNPTGVVIRVVNGKATKVVK